MHPAPCILHRACFVCVLISRRDPSIAQGTPEFSVPKLSCCVSHHALLSLPSFYCYRTIGSFGSHHRISSEAPALRHPGLGGAITLCCTPHCACITRICSNVSLLRCAGALRRSSPQPRLERAKSQSRRSSTQSR